MNRNQLLIALGAVVFAAMGVALYRWQGPAETPIMNLWGVVSFASLGACVGCLVVDPSDTRFDLWP